MEASERTVLATLAYYGALRWPLTVVELTRHIIPSGRLGATAAVPKLGDVVAITEKLAASGRIRTSSGLYTIGAMPVEIASNRIIRHARSAATWRRMLRAAWWLQMVPFVRMLAASGSLAMGSSGEQSDWDMLVVVRARRLYTARLGLLVVAGLLGRLRTKRMRTAPDRFCFNHIITTDGLAIRHRSLYTAHALSWIVPFYDLWGYGERLRHANRWVTEYVCSTGDELFERRELRHSRVLAAVRWVAELVLNTFVGRVVEYAVRRWMQQRIERVPATHERGGRIIADERELEFHPHSFEAVALARYNASLKQLGLGQFAEHDSGLRH